MRVWITDDDTIFHFIVERFAQSLPQVNELRFFTNGQAMVDTLADCQTGPDVVLLDLNMPVMNGFEVMEHLDQQPELADRIGRLYVISSSMLPEERDRSLGYPFVEDFYPKPLFVHHFAEIVLGEKATDNP